MSSRFQERENNQSPMNSPRNSNVSSSITNNNTNNCIQIPTSPLTPRTITTPRSDSNPYPTTFVQADTSTFKHVVQMLTGSSDTTTNTTKTKQQQQHQQQDLLSLPLPPPPPSRSFNIPPKKQGFKLYERRNNSLMMKNNNTLMINTLMPNYAQNIITNNNNFSPRKPEILSPSLLDFPSLALSPVTPLINDDPFDKSSSSPYSLGNSSSSEEDKAIAEKGFYLHPSPRTTTSSSSSSTPNKPPQLLPLFPVTSPRVSESSSSS